MPLPKNWLLKPILAPILRPLVRLLVGLLAIPLLRSIRNRYRPDAAIDSELEKDIEQWTRASLVLLLATKNVEAAISDFLHLEFSLTLNENNWLIAAGRLLLAIGVVESMPDQQLFSIIHPGPPPLKWRKGLSLWQNLKIYTRPFLKGIACQHLNRSSPVFAIMTTIFSGPVGWACYFLAITQYLIIGLVTSRDKALDVLSEFDRQVARRRREIELEFAIPPVTPSHSPEPALPRPAVEKTDPAA
ncbi:DNA topoisomerase I [Planctomicrobium sp. SH664]|uniref:DNA topoisomerase I n=1 Tax=Planctomicrobium sp. SH664 TaxID=3448125 RepID=UPI003F5C247E